MHYHSVRYIMYFSKKKYVDDTKSIERAKKELLKIDEQLQVIHAKTEAIRQEHHELEQVFKV